MLNRADPQDVRSRLQIDVAGRKIDDEIVVVGILAYEAKLEAQSLFSVVERLFERVGDAAGRCRGEPRGQGDEDGDRESQ